MEKTCLVHFEGFVCVCVHMSLCMYIFLYVFVCVCMCVRVDECHGVYVSENNHSCYPPPSTLRLGLFVIYICVADIRQAGWGT